jgi:short chain dehydrogenase
MKELPARYGQYALVTGASSGIGAEFAEQLAAAAGLSLALVARRKDRLDALAQRLRAAYGTATEVIELDLAADGAVAELARRTGRLDIGLVVASAGIVTSGPFPGQRPRRRVGAAAPQPRGTRGAGPRLRARPRPPRPRRHHPGVVRRRVRPGAVHGQLRRRQGLPRLARPGPGLRAKAREPAEEAGLRFAPLQGIAGFPALREAGYFEARAKLPPGPPQLDYDFTRLFYEPVPDQHATLQRLPAEQPDTPAVVITDQSFMDHWAVRLGAPGIRPAAVIGIGVVPLSLNSTDTAPFGLGLPPDSSPEGKQRNAAQSQVAEELLAGSTSVLRAILKDLGATGGMPFPMDAIVSLPDLFLQFAPAEAEYPRSDLPPGVRFTEPAARRARRRASPALVGRRPHRQPGHRRDPGYGRQPGPRPAHRARPAGAGRHRRSGRRHHRPGRRGPGRCPGQCPGRRLRAVLRAPAARQRPGHQRRLRGPSLQALAHGVPLVIAGQSEDKAEVAARLAWTGAALNLATDAPRPPRPTSVPPSRRSPAAPPTAPTPSDCKPRSGGAVPSTRSLRPSPRSQATEAQHTKSAR